MLVRCLHTVLLLYQGVEQNDMSSVGGPPTVGASAHLSALCSLPLTSSGGGAPGSTAATAHAEPPGLLHSTAAAAVSAAGSGGMQQSLMGGKARYR